MWVAWLSLLPDLPVPDGSAVFCPASVREAVLAALAALAGVALGDGEAEPAELEAAREQLQSAVGRQRGEGALSVRDAEDDS